MEGVRCRKLDSKKVIHMLQPINKFEFASSISRRIFLVGSFALAFGITSLAVGQSDSKGAFAPLQMTVPSVVQRSLPMGPTDPKQLIHITVNLFPANPAGLKTYADSVSDPQNPNYHNFITPDQVGKMFGQSTANVDKVVSYLKSQGFTIKLVADSHFAILADGTVAQAQAAFNTHINNYHALSASEPGRRDFYSVAEQPQLPASIASSVLYVEGLSNFTKPKPMANALTPTQTRTLYNSAPIYDSGLQGQGRHVAISNWDGFRLSNVPLYYKQFNLPTPSGGVGSNITVVTVNGGAGSGTPEGEGDLDIQMVLGMAPLASFLIYDGAPGALTAVLTKEQNDNIADIISESWGWNLDTSAALAVHNIHLAMTAQGITYMAASGDSGTSLEPFSYPNYDGEVLMVGGTVATVDSKGNRVNEPSWDGGGGGWSTNSSTFNVLPSWQKGKGVPTTINYRLSPDISFNASGNNTGAYQFFYNGVISNDYSGTSFSCPVFAGLLTVAEQKIIAQGGLSKAPHRFGRIQDVIYKQNGSSSVFYDVTQGVNGTLPNGQLSSAGIGWDFCSGWGAMIMDGFVKAVAVSATKTYSAGTASVYTNTYLTPAVTEGNFISGTVSSLATADGDKFVVSPINQAGLGRVASVQASYATGLKPASAASLNVLLTASIPAKASVMIYIYNWTTKAYDLLQTLSGTQAGQANNIAVNKALTNYFSATGQVQLLTRSLVPAGKAGVVGSYTYQVDQLAISASQSLSN